MMDSLFAYISLILSVVLGGVFVTVLKAKNKPQFIKLLLAFSGGFLLAIAFTHFIPELYHHAPDSIGLFILLGFLIQLLLEFFSGGIEHGHVHIHKGQSMPWGLFISLSVHSVLEGIPLGYQLNGMAISETVGHHHDSSLLMGILFHQLPVAIALMTLLLNTNLTRTKAWFILMMFGIMTPLGVLIGQLDFIIISDSFANYILAVVVGMFLHISTTIIFETSENHKFNLLKLGSIFIGVALAIGIQ
jgi:zinc transporter ZupT